MPFSALQLSPISSSYYCSSHCSGHHSGIEMSQQMLPGLALEQWRQLTPQAVGARHFVLTSSTVHLFTLNIICCSISCSPSLMICFQLMKQIFKRLPLQLACRFSLGKDCSLFSKTIYALRVLPTNLNGLSNVFLKKQIYGSGFGKSNWSLLVYSL